MNKKKEPKNNLITVRITEDEMNTLDYLSDCIGQSKSDTLLRASKFLLNTLGGTEGDDVEGSRYGTYFDSGMDVDCRRREYRGGGLSGGRAGSRSGNREGSGTDGGARKNCQVHLRITDAEMDIFNERCLAYGLTVSQLVRKGIKNYERFKRGSY
jgi:hypothetical protein